MAAKADTEASRWRLPLRVAVFLAFGGIVLGCGGTRTTEPSPSPPTGPHGAPPSATGPASARSGTKAINTIRIRWNASAIPNILGYVILHGTAPGSYFESRWVGIGTTYDFTVSQTGVHYFAVKVQDTDGRESPASTPVSVSVP